MKIIKLVFLPFRLLAALIILIFLAVAGYFGFKIFQQAKGTTSNNQFCHVWSKEEVDSTIKNVGLETFDSTINCNTYYLELKSVEVSRLLPLETSFTYDLDFQFMIENETEYISGTFDNNRKLIYSITAK